MATRIVEFLLLPTSPIIRVFSDLNAVTILWRWISRVLNADEVYLTNYWASQRSCHAGLVVLYTLSVESCWWCIAV